MVTQLHCPGPPQLNLMEDPWQWSQRQHASLSRGAQAQGSFFLGVFILRVNLTMGESLGEEGEGNSSLFTKGCIFQSLSTCVFVEFPKET